MDIRVYLRSVDGFTKSRSFKTLKGAQKFAQSYVGEHPEIGPGYAISSDGVCRITAMGVGLRELFPTKVEDDVVPEPAPPTPEPTNGGQKSKAWTKETIKQLLAVNDKAVIRAVVALTDRQTVEEQIGGVTIKRNNVGFNANDAFLSKYADFYRDRGFMSPKMINIARRRIMKYSGQLLEIAQERTTVTA